MSNGKIFVWLLIAAAAGVAWGFTMARQPCTTNAAATVVGVTTFYGTDPPRITVYFSDGTKQEVRPGDTNGNTQQR